MEDELVEFLTLDEKKLAPEMERELSFAREIWVTRDLSSGTYDFQVDSYTVLDFPTRPIPVQAANPADETAPETADDAVAESFLAASEVAASLRDHWPSFVYFDTFEDILPKTVDFAVIQSAADAATQSGTNIAPSTSLPRPVLDYLTLADVDIATIKKYETQEKALNNYLSNRSAVITGDFLTYWKQTNKAEDSVTLIVKQQRTVQGALQLSFWVHDDIDQYPEQRSKGFLWFLSFYLRLAAAHVRNQGKNRRFLLIDEPGTYLHARAQQDVLHLFEDRLSKSDMILYSTHSHFLIPAAKLHRLRIVLKTPERGSQTIDRLTHPLLRSANFSDTLSPILEAIGLDIRQAAAFVRDRNLIVEGISEHYYISTMSQLLLPTFLEQFHIFPATGALSEVTLASLFVGWGLSFAALLDRDANGNAAKNKLIRELGVAENRVIQPEQAAGFEDLFSLADFRNLLARFDAALSINDGERPTAAIVRQHIDKVLLARTFAEATGAFNCSAETRERVLALFRAIQAAF